MVSGSSAWEPKESTRSAKKRRKTGSEQPWTSAPRVPTSMSTQSRLSAKRKRSRRAAGGEGLLLLDGLALEGCCSVSRGGGGGGGAVVAAATPGVWWDGEGRWKASSSGRAHSSAASAWRTTTRALISSGSAAAALDMEDPPRHSAADANGEGAGGDRRGGRAKPIKPACLCLPSLPFVLFIYQWPACALPCLGLAWGDLSSAHLISLGGGV